MPTPAPISTPALPSAKSAGDEIRQGNELLQAGRTADAIKAFERAVKANPSSARAWQNLALAYQTAGNDAKALEAFRNAKAAPKP